MTFQKILGNKKSALFLLFFGVLYQSFINSLANIFGKLKLSSALHKVYKEVEISAFLTEIKYDASLPFHVIQRLQKGQELF